MFCFSPSFSFQSSRPFGLRTILNTTRVHMAHLGNTTLSQAICTQCLPCHLPPVHSVHCSCLPPVRLQKSLVPFSVFLFLALSSVGNALNSQQNLLPDLHSSLVSLLRFPLLTSCIRSSSSPSSSDVGSPAGAHLASHPTRNSLHELRYSSATFMFG